VTRNIVAQVARHPPAELDGLAPAGRFGRQRRFAHRDGENAARRVLTILTKAIGGSSGEIAMYIVEVRRDGDELAAPMSEMRSWLDNERIQLSVFRLSLIPGGTIFRLEFKAVSEAEVFARVFAGEVIADERTGAIAA
jgi:hypothetical protein